MKWPFNFRYWNFKNLHIYGLIYLQNRTTAVCHHLVLHQIRTSHRSFRSVHDYNCSSIIAQQKHRFTVATIPFTVSPKLLYLYVVTKNQDVSKSCLKTAVACYDHFPNMINNIIGSNDEYEHE